MMAPEPVRHLRDAPSWPLASGPAAVPAAVDSQLPAASDGTQDLGSAALDGEKKKPARKGWGRNRGRVAKPTGTAPGENT